MTLSGHPMHVEKEKGLLLADVLPAFAAELQQLLEERGEPGIGRTSAGIGDFRPVPLRG